MVGDSGVDPAGERSWKEGTTTETWGVWLSLDYVVTKSWVTDLWPHGL